MNSGMTVAATNGAQSGGHSGAAPNAAVARILGAAVSARQGGAGALPRVTLPGLSSFRANWHAQLEVLSNAAEQSGIEGDEADGTNGRSTARAALAQRSPTDGPAPPVSTARQTSGATAVAASSSACGIGSRVAHASRAEAGAAAIGVESRAFDLTFRPPAETRTSQTAEREGKPGTRKAAGEEVAAAGVELADSSGVIAALPVSAVVTQVPLSNLGANQPGQPNLAEVNSPRTSAAASQDVPPVVPSVVPSVVIVSPQGSDEPATFGGEAVDPPVAQATQSMAGPNAGAHAASAPIRPPSAEEPIHSEPVALTSHAVEGVPAENRQPFAAAQPPGAYPASAKTDDPTHGPAAATAGAAAAPAQGAAAFVAAGPMLGAASTPTNRALASRTLDPQQSTVISINSANTVDASNLSMQNMKSSAEAPIGGISPPRSVRPGEAAGRRAAPSGPPTGESAPNAPSGIMLHGPAPGLEPSAARGAILAEASRAESAGAGRHDPFTELDSAPGTVTWSHTGPRQAEAGFEDPALGWIGVRAEMSGGGVHAEVVPGSAGAALELGRQMEGLHSYVAEQRMPVDSLSMASSGGHGGDPADAQQMQQNPQGQSSGQHETETPQPVRTGRGEGGADSTVSASSGLRTTAERAALNDFQAGKSISVMA